MEDKIADYIQSFPPAVQTRLIELRRIILDLAPGVEEGFSYGMPAYKLNGKPLVYYAGYKHHIGFYATPSGHSAFKTELSRYKQGKGSVQFPLNQPLPHDLVRRIILFRVKEQS